MSSSTSRGLKQATEDTTIDFSPPTLLNNLEIEEKKFHINSNTKCVNAKCGNKIIEN